MLSIQTMQDVLTEIKNFTLPKLVNIRSELVTPQWIFWTTGCDLKIVGSGTKACDESYQSALIECYHVLFSSGDSRQHQHHKIQSEV